MQGMGRRKRGLKKWIQCAKILCVFFSCFFGLSYFTVSYCVVGLVLWCFRFIPWVVLHLFTCNDNVCYSVKGMFKHFSLLLLYFSGICNNSSVLANIVLSLCYTDCFCNIRNSSVIFPWIIPRFWTIPCLELFPCWKTFSWINIIALLFALK